MTNIEDIFTMLEKMRLEDKNSEFVTTVHEAMFMLNYKPSLQRMSRIVDRLIGLDSNPLDAS